MITPEISKYAKDELAKGTSPESLRTTLSSSGWSATDIDQLLSPNPVPPPPPTPSTNTIPAATGNNHRTLITALLLIFLNPIGLIVMWVWSGWKVWVKILVTVLSLIPVVLAILWMGTLMALAAKYYSSPSSFITNSTSTFPSSLTSTTPAADLMSVYRTSFVSACQSSAGNSEQANKICVCVADELIAGHTPEELVQISQTYTSTGQMPEAVTQALQLCTSSEITQ